MKLGERTVNNALFNAISGLFPLLFSFIFWPYIVTTLGDSSYGIFALVGTVIGYFALLDLGLGNAVVKYVAEYDGQQDQDRVREVIGVTLTIFTVAGLIGVVLILVLAKVLAEKILKIPPELTEAAYLSFCAASAGFFFTMILTLFTSIINGLNRYDISSVTTAVMGITTTLGSVALLRMGFRLVSLVWLSVVITVLALIFYMAIIRRLLPDIRIRLMVQADMIKRVIRFGMYATLSRITNVIVRQVDLLIIGALLSVSSVTYYVIPFTILNRLTGLIWRIGMVMFPAVSELQGQNRHDTICDLYLTSSRIILSFATAFTVPMLLFGVRFLHLWMGPEFAERCGVVMLVITLGIYSNQCTNVPSFVVNGLGRPKISGLTALSTALLFLGLMVPGAIYFGILGVAIAFTASGIIINPVFIRYVNCKVLGLSLRELVKESYLRPLLAGITVMLLLLLVPQERIQNLFVLLAVMGSAMALYLVVALLFGVYQKRERRVLMQYFKNVISRVRKKH